MIIYLLLELVLFILGVISDLFGSFIPDFPNVIIEVLNTISTMISGGIEFLTYFFNPAVVIALVSLVIAWHSFSLVKDAVMKVVGHFMAN